MRVVSNVISCVDFYLIEIRCLTRVMNCLRSIRNSVNNVFNIQCFEWSVSFLVEEMPWLQGTISNRILSRAKRSQTSCHLQNSRFLPKVNPRQRNHFKPKHTSRHTTNNGKNMIHATFENLSQIFLPNRYFSSENYQIFGHCFVISSIVNRSPLNYCGISK